MSVSVISVSTVASLLLQRNVSTSGAHCPCTVAFQNGTGVVCLVAVHLPRACAPPSFLLLLSPGFTAHSLLTPTPCCFLHFLSYLVPVHFLLLNLFCFLAAKENLWPLCYHLFYLCCFFNISCFVLRMCFLRRISCPERLRVSATRAVHCCDFIIKAVQYCSPQILNYTYILSLFQNVPC